jgi:hypothetical protein
MALSEAATPIEIPYPQADDAQLRIAMGPCRLRVTPGAEGALARGSYEDPSGLLPARVSVEGSRVTLTQGPSLDRVGKGIHAAVPVLELRLGADHPFALAVDGGANECTFDLGGVPLIRLTFHQGAGKSVFDFSAPNPVEMSMLDIGAGAVVLELHHLANANAAAIRVSGGAASYLLDFEGTLTRDADVQVSAGMSSVEIRLPAAVAAKVRSDAVLGSVDVGDGFTTREGAFCTAAAIEGKSPLISVKVTVALGSFKLRSMPSLS